MLSPLYFFTPCAISSNVVMFIFSYELLRETRKDTTSQESGVHSWNSNLPQLLRYCPLQHRHRSVSLPPWPHLLLHRGAYTSAFILPMLYCTVLYCTLHQLPVTLSDLHVPAIVASAIAVSTPWITIVGDILLVHFVIVSCECFISI